MNSLLFAKSSYNEWREISELGEFKKNETAYTRTSGTGIMTEILPNF